MVARTMLYHLEVYGHSDPGLVRLKNEDVWGEQISQRFFALADGMGGHKAGDVAAADAVDALSKLIGERIEEGESTQSLDETMRVIRKSIQEVNRIINLKGQTNDNLKGMGTTLCCLQFHDRGLIYAHVGDSRIYRFREDVLLQLTEDHSLVQELVDMGQIDKRQAEDFAYRNIITKAIGTESMVDPAVEVAPIQSGDLYLMCSDGLSDMLTHQEIEEIVSQITDVKEGTLQLIRAAKKKGGHDNVTVVLVRVDAIDEG